MVSPYNATAHCYQCRNQRQWTGAGLNRRHQDFQSWILRMRLHGGFGGASSNSFRLTYHAIGCSAFRAAEFNRSNSDSDMRIKYALFFGSVLLMYRNISSR